MMIKNQEKIAEISHLIPPNLNMFGVSEDQNEKVLKKINGLNELKLAEFLKCDRNYFVQPITENGYKFLTKTITYKVRERENGSYQK